jgi:hypothetical protein
MRTSLKISLLLVAALGGCKKTPPILLLPDTGLIFGNEDAGFGDTGPRDGGPGPGENIVLSGVVRSLDDYLAGRPVAVADVTVGAKGVVGVNSDSTNATGAFAMRIPQNGLVTLSGEKAGYLPSYETFPVGSLDVTGANLLLGSTNYVGAIAQTYGVDITTPFTCHAPNPTTSMCKYAMVAGRIVDDGTEANDGTATPLGGVTKDEFVIRANGDPTWYKKGPYFLSPVGMPGAGYTTSQRDRSPVSQRYRGGAYVVFLEIPVDGPAEQEFQLTANSAAGGTLTRYFGPVSVRAVRDGVSWRVLPQTGQGQPVTPPPPPPPPVNVDFDTQVYPIFLPLNLGGYGCQGCHTDQGGNTPSGGMNLYGGPEIAYNSLNPANYPNRVNLANPAASYVLVRPLYEANGIQDHPIYAFPDTTNASYQLLLAWIQQGAQRVVTPPIGGTVSFYNDVRPLLYRPSEQGGAGCYACHVNGVDAATAPGGFYMGGNGNDLYYAITASTAADNGGTGEPYRINKTLGNAGYSLLLINPLSGNIEPHPVKLFYGVDDPRYQLIYTWISEGYINDTP